jgi:hypothetical protein
MRAKKEIEKQKDTHDAYGLPNDIKKAKEEVHDWRQACASAFGVTTANPHKTLMEIAKELDGLKDFKRRAIEEFKLIKQQTADSIEFLGLDNYLKDNSK